MEESWKQIADEKANDPCIVEHLDQVGNEQSHKDGQNCSYKLHGQAEEERVPGVILAGVPPKDDHVHVIDHSEHHQREHRADVKSGEQDDVVGEDSQGNGVSGLTSAILQVTRWNGRESLPMNRSNIGL